MNNFQEVRQLASRAQLKEAIELFLKEEHRFRDMGITLQARLESLVQQELMGVIDFNQANIERNSIRASLIYLVSTLEQEMATAKNDKDELYDVPDNEGLEKIIDKNGLKPIEWYHRVSQNSKSICKIHTSDGYVGTGFLVGGGYLFTNNHVIGSASIAQYSRAEFGYDVAGAASIFYDLNHNDFVTSEHLDYTRVKVKVNDGQKPLSEWGELKIVSTLPDNDEDLVIIQHPQGRRKEVAYSEGTKNSFWEHRLHYKVTTEPGSSGSPVFDVNWNVVALHHAGGNLRVNAGGEKRYINEGVLFKYIIEDMLKQGSVSSTKPPVKKTPAENEQSDTPVKILLVYNPKDAAFADDLDSHLFSYRRAKDIAIFDMHNDVPADANVEDVLQRQLDDSKVILILISKSLYRRDTRKFALKVERMVGVKRVVPIKVSPFDLVGTSFEPLQGLPRNNISLSESSNLDATLLRIAKEIKEVIEAVK